VSGRDDHRSLFNGVLQMMIWRWRYFVAAVLLAGLLLLTNGAPPMPVFAGIAGAAMFMWRRGSRLS